MQKNFKNIKFIDCKENRGKATALQLGMHAVTFEFVICVDSDATIDDNAHMIVIKNNKYYDAHNAFRSVNRIFTFDEKNILDFL